MYETKTINGMASVGNRLADAASQSERIILDVADKTHSRLLATELRTFYERNPQIKDVLIFKGKKEIHVDFTDVKSRRFVEKFMKSWAN